ncbi:MAG: enoyl-ACP reductase FabI [Acidimicrobiia bacterium]|nr:enoyl-ACP reductase FabI [Acidimicrobiia bacterium]
MTLLEGKRLLITGVLTDKSIAFAVARTALEEGAHVVLTGAGRGLSLTQKVAQRLPEAPDVLEMDVNASDHIAAVAQDLRARWGEVDGVLHAIGFAPAECLGGDFLAADWESVAVALQTSAYSLAAIARGLGPVLADGASIVSLDFDARVAWPSYDWMGVAKAALESITRYCARELGPRGIRVNALAAGPLRTMAAKSIPGFERFEDAWSERAPLGWDITDPAPVAKMACVLLSDWSQAVTGELLHVDGGYHAMGA